MPQHITKIFLYKEQNQAIFFLYKENFEVGGKNKSFSQIADKPDSFVIADNIETGIGNKIPIWLLGFMY